MGDLGIGIDPTSHVLQSSLCRPAAVPNNSSSIRGSISRPYYRQTPWASAALGTWARRPRLEKVEMISKKRLIGVGHEPSFQCLYFASLRHPTAIVSCSAASPSRPAPERFREPSNPDNQLRS
ncbi:hypothetical protein KC325_g306 [Hortaea werneckii]|nr:hypothetical protein KC325_g306 [Hortaea werneckii]